MQKWLTLIGQTRTNYYILILQGVGEVERGLDIPSPCQLLLNTSTKYVTQFRGCRRLEAVIVGSRQQCAIDWIECRTASVLSQERRLHVLTCRPQRRGCFQDVVADRTNCWPIRISPSPAAVTRPFTRLNKSKSLPGRSEWDGGGGYGKSRGVGKTTQHLSELRAAAAINIDRHSSKPFITAL